MDGRDTRDALLVGSAAAGATMLLSLATGRELVMTSGTFDLYAAAPILLLGVTLGLVARKLTGLPDLPVGWELAGTVIVFLPMNLAVGMLAVVEPSGTEGVVGVLLGGSVSVAAFALGARSTLAEEVDHESV